MALAQRLNELAIANSDGLLNDDEYRLLRQNVFEQYSTNAVIPVEAPVVPIARVHVVQGRGISSSSSTSYRRPAAKGSLEQRNVPPSPGRSMSAVTSGMANLLRRATGRKTPNPVHDSPTTKDTRRGNGASHAAKDTPKLSVMIPRMLHHKKPAELHLPPRTDSCRPWTDTLRSPRLRTPRPTNEQHPSSPHPLSPSRSSSRQTALPVPSVRLENSHSTNHDVFDDDNLTTAKDIRKMISITEDEVRRLVDAFNNLETSTVGRLQKQKARRLPTTTPANVNVLLEGREWREHRLIPSPSSPLSDSKQRFLLNSVNSNNGGSDGVSIRSGSSNKTTLSQSKSISSLPKISSPGSPLAPRFRPLSFATIQRKSSTSSTSSQGTASFTSNGMLGVSPSSTHSRSTTHLPPAKLKKIPGMISTETISLAPSGDADADVVVDDDDSELSDIRKRREELIARYAARLEFLRAKLKGAELHEKLLRK